MEQGNESYQTLYKIRDVGAALNDTFGFLRANFSRLFLPLILIVWPVKVIVTYIFTYKIQRAITGSEIGGTYYFSRLITSMLIILMVMLINTLMNIILVVYMRMNEENKRPPTLPEMLPVFFKKLPIMLIVNIIIGVLIIVGFVFVLVPGVYLTVVFSLILPIVVIENKGVGDALNRSFKLISNRFWSTFGLLIILIFIIATLNLLGEVPFIIINFTKSLSGYGNNYYYNADPYSPSILIPLLITELVNTVTYSIYIVAIVIWYYSLVEDKDGVNALNVLQQIKTVQPTGNEGDF